MKYLKYIKSIDPAELKQMFGIAFQNDTIFSDTIKENIVFGRNISEDDFDTEFINLKVKNEVIVEQQDEFEYVFLYDFYKVEEDIAIKLKSLSNAKNIKKVKNIKAEILKQEQISKHRIQMQALQL